MTTEEHAWLLRIEQKIDTMILSGCSKAPTHEDHEKRLRAVENQQAESRGKIVILSGLISIVAVFIGRLFK